MSYPYAIYIVIMLLAIFPLRNFLEIRGLRKQYQKIFSRVSELPNKEGYLSKHQQVEIVVCDYCGSNRQRPHSLGTVPYEPKFGFFSNTISLDVEFSTYACSKCGTQLYAERIEKNR